MNKPLNNYLQLLTYLKQFEGDGQFHSIEDILSIEKQQKQAIWTELAIEKYIILNGGYEAGGITFGNGSSFGFGYVPAEAKITIHGSKYLKEELQMIDSGRYNIHIGDNSTANLILHSPGGTINNKTEVLAKAKEIINAIQSDQSLDPAVQNDAMTTISRLVDEVQVGTPEPNTVAKVLTIGSNIASIGSLVIALYQLITLLK